MMPTLEQLVDDFLAQERIAVAGVSRSSGEAANAIYKKLRKNGYRVYPLNPNADTVEGDTCYANLQALPEPVDGVVIATHPAATDQVVRDCALAGVSRVWMHRSLGQGSASDAAVEFCRQQGISVIPGGCPMMFCRPDIAHKCLRWFLSATGKLPKEL
ncbi:MAG: CoA-binding protein [Chloroflexi bacterium]|nr:MAG: CoA-binding protein [Chloroflexota bacterium]